MSAVESKKQCRLSPMRGKCVVYKADTGGWALYQGPPDRATRPEGGLLSQSKAKASAYSGNASSMTVRV